MDKKAGGKNRSWSLFGKKDGKDSDAAKAAAAAAEETFGEEEEASSELTVTFVAGPLGLSVTNDVKRGNALCVTKAAGQAGEHGIGIGDEILALNNEPCRGAKSDDFKKLIIAAGRPFDLTVHRAGDGDESVMSSEASTASSAAASQAAAEALAAKKAEEKRQIEEAKAKALQRELQAVEVRVVWL
jgi:C-terminal processing protease CtpA/Prc